MNPSFVMNAGGATETLISRNAPSWISSGDFLLTYVLIAAMTFASRDDLLSSEDLQAYIQGYGQWAEQLINQGFSAYITSFMFKPGMIRKIVKEENKWPSIIMEEEIKRIFARFLTECVRCLAQKKIKETCLFYSAAKIGR